VINGGHTWPGTTVNNGFGNTNQDFNASLEIWRFFSQYSLNVLTDLSNSKTESAKESISVYANSKNGTIQVKSTTPIEKIHVYNLQGQTVKTISGNGLLNLDICIQASGIFMLNMTTINGSVTKKVMLKY